MIATNLNIKNIVNTLSEPDQERVMQTINATTADVTSQRSMLEADLNRTTVAQENRFGGLMNIAKSMSTVGSEAYQGSNWFKLLQERVNDPLWTSIDSGSRGTELYNKINDLRLKLTDQFGEVLTQAVLVQVIGDSFRRGMLGDDGLLVQPEEFDKNLKYALAGMQEYQEMENRKAYIQNSLLSGAEFTTSYTNELAYAAKQDALNNTTKHTQAVHDKYNANNPYLKYQQRKDDEETARQEAKLKQEQQETLAAAEKERLRKEAEQAAKKESDTNLLIRNTRGALTQQLPIDRSIFRPNLTTPVEDSELQPTPEINNTIRPVYPTIDFETPRKNKKYTIFHQAPGKE
jgi:hypothetical protein